MNPALIIAGAVALWYVLAKSKTPTGTPSNSIGLASTTSPYGSASGVLTPVSPSQTGLMSGLEAFESSLGLSVAPVSQQNIDQSLSLSSGDAIEYGAAYEAPTSAPEIGNTAGISGVDLSYLGGEPDITAPTE